MGQRNVWQESRGVALILYAFNELIIAHSRLVTTDIGVSFAIFLGMYTLYRFLKNPKPLNLILAGLTFALALLTKFSGPILAPAYVVVFVVCYSRLVQKEETGFLAKIHDKRLKERFKSGFLAFVIVGAIAFFTMWLVYVPHTINMPSSVQKTLIEQSLPQNTGLAKIAKDTLIPMSGNPVTKPLAQWFLGFEMVASHVEGGHHSFFMGKVGNGGWLLYYPVALAIKTPYLDLFSLFSLLFSGKFDKKGWFDEVFL